MAKIRYLMKVRGFRSTAQQFLKFEQIPGVSKSLLRAGIMKTLGDAKLSEEQRLFFEKRIQVVMSAEQTFHRRGRDHRRCAKDFDLRKAPSPSSFQGWKARKSDEVVLLDKSLDVPRIVEKCEVSRAYRREVARMAACLGMPNDTRNDLMRVVSRVVAQSAELVATPVSEAYVAELESIPEGQVLVGLDRNPKSAAVMTKGCYRAGMMDTYALDVDHYKVILDEAQGKKAVADAQERVWQAMPKWVRRKNLTVGYEYLNLKEK